MLTLHRKLNEQIVIGDNIVITVVSIDRYRGTVRLGITAPRDVPISRPDAHKQLPRETK